MKSALKIIGLTILGLLITVLAVIIIAVYAIFTPERLTPIARQAAGTYITCEYEIGEVDLTFFSTFPRFGLRADGLLLVNPKAGAQSDTVVSAPRFVATVDVKELLKNNTLHVHEVALDEAEVNFFIAPDGSTNLTDVFVTSPDTTEEDTTAFSLPFDALHVDGIRIHAKSITFVDAKDTIEASLGTTELRAQAANWHDMSLSLQAEDLCARLQGETYADHIRLSLKAPMVVDLESMHFVLNKANLAVNEFALGLDGEVTLGDTMDIHARLQTGKWQIKPLLALVPATFTSSLQDLDLDGQISLAALIQGAYSDTQMPLITANILLEEGQGAYKPLPYTLRDMHLDASASLNLNQGQVSNVIIRSLTAKTKDSRISAKGTVKDLMGNMLLDLQLGLDAHLPDFAYFMPDSMEVTGHAKGTAKAKIRLEDLSEMRLQKGQLSADLQLTDIHYAQSDMIADLPKTHAQIRIPNGQPSRKAVDWARVDLEADQLHFIMGDSTDAQFQAPVVQIEVANILADQQEYFASLAFRSLDAVYGDITAQLQQSELEAFVSGGHKISAKLKTDALQGGMGEELTARTGTLALEASARYNKEAENALLKWNPRLKINLKNGELNLPQRLPETVHIPSIEFKYSNREMTIDNSRIELGNSDLNLKGNVRHIGKWLRHQAILEGELDIISNHCDANQLMAWFSADEGSEEASQEQKNDQMVNDQMVNESDPFLVPMDVDLALHTHMQEVEIFNQTAKDLKGGLYIKDGILILDEVGFVCRAAKLQLTGMYRTPRRNDLYVGIDYHMVDVDIDELLSMIPDLEQMVPMLSSFKGSAEFHLAAETYLTSQYKPKMSTLRGAASLTGKDLVVLDGETFDQIAKLLKFNKKTENKIDSLNAELTIYKNEIDVYPLCVQMDNYMVALGGRHRTDMTFDYDINVLSPIYLGVHVGGNMDNLDIKLAKCKYAQDFRPHWYQKADTQSLELRQRIKQSMEKNVRIK